MELERQARISDIYHRALARPPAERTAYLRDACQGDAGLFQELESMLQYEPGSARFLEHPAASFASDPASSSDHSEMIGRHLGPYTIVAPLGAGGMGQVYRARDSKLGRDVAIKVLPPHFTADPERRSRFSREARLLATLNHPHIGSIYGLEESNGLTGLVLELVEGPTLADRLDGGPLSIPKALAIGRQIAEALEAAHEKGIVHRDLKPNNVVLQPTSSTNDVRAKVLDFGLAKVMGDPNLIASGTVQSTEDGRILGTPAYMSPEQARGQAVDKRTDIWAFGCVLYEMLTGRRAFAGDTMSDTVARVLEHEPDWTALPADTPASIRTLLDRCLRKDPGERLHDIGDARIEIDEWSSRGGRGGRVSWSRAAILTSIALGLLGLIGFGVWMSGPQPAQQPPSLRRLTFGDGLQTDPTFSADGSLIAYASSKSGKFDIWMQPVEGGNAVQVTDDPANDTQPDWSPKTNQIVFRSERDGGGLFVAPATGGRAERVSGFGYNPRWSPDGRASSLLNWIYAEQGTGGYTLPDSVRLPPLST